MATPTERVLEKLDDLGTDVAVIKSSLPNLTQQIADHERRLRSLEARTWYGLGAVGIVAFVVPVVIRWLG